MSDIKVIVGLTLEAHLGILHLNIPNFQGFSGTKLATVYCDEVSVIDDGGQNAIQVETSALQVFSGGSSSASVTLDSTKKTVSISGISFSGQSGKMLNFTMTAAQIQSGNTFYFQGFCSAVIP